KKAAQVDACAAGERLGSAENKLDRFCCRSRRRGGSGLGKSAATRLFLRGLIDFDGALKVSAVFDHDARRGEIAYDRTILLDLDTIFRAKVALHVSVNDHFASDDISGHLRSGADGEFPLGELDQSFDRAIDLQIFIAVNLAS